MKAMLIALALCSSLNAFAHDFSSAPPVVTSPEPPPTAVPPPSVTVPPEWVPKYIGHEIVLRPHALYHLANSCAELQGQSMTLTNSTPFGGKIVRYETCAFGTYFVVHTGRRTIMIESGLNQFELAN